jgi:two-component system cell cycle sensor histidine kinase/response regulator CckA
MSELLRVLLVEDNAGDADLIRELLPKDGPVSFEIKHAPRLETALELVAAGDFDLILLDLGLPDSAGLDTVRAMRQQAPDLPIVVLTGNDDERMGLAAIQEGAQEYVVKGEITGAFFPRVLRYAQERFLIMLRLRESEERLRLTLDAVNDGVWDWHVPSGRAVFSPHWYDMLGYEPDEFAASYDSWRSLVHPDEIERVEDELRAHIASGDAYAIEMRMRTKLGDWRWILTRGRVIEREGDGSPIRLVGTHSDITQRVEAERTLRERDDQLRQAQKMEAVGQLAGGIAHDFNNLLTAIIGYSDLLLTGPELADSPVRKDLEQIRRAAERATALTRQILAFSRSHTLRPTVVSLNDVLAGVEPLLRRTLGEHVDLVCAQGPDLGHVEVDVHQFEQVLMNLALNARDAMASGGRLTLETANVELDKEYCRAHPHATPGSFVMLAVSDTGVGMDATTMERVFEPFFTTKDVGQGTGLGLAMVYGTVRQSNGSISVYSEPGKGTSFKIYLPRTMAAIQEETPVTTDVALARAHETILVVEDEASLLDLVARVLSGLGYRVLSAGTAAEAVRVAKESEFQFDLLLTDVVLSGGVQGNELARDLCTHMPGLPVLYMSGYTRNAIVHPGRLDAGVKFLEKPFTPGALATMVRAALGQTRSSG